MDLALRFFDGSDWLAFSSAHQVWRASTVDDALVAFDEAEAALSSGMWIAGYLSYELGAAFAHESIRSSAMPLLCLAAFDAPTRAEPAPERSGTLSPLLPQVTRERYDETIARIQRRIYDGEVYQVNYTIPYAVSIEGDPLAAWCAIASMTGARYQAYVEDGTRRMLCWSPELFLRFDGERIVTRPMKGTAPLEDRAALESEKNRAEHVMIVDLLRNDLHRVCDDVAVESLFTQEAYRSFATMTSTIAGTVRGDVSLREIFQAMFPCGSVTGAPKRAAVRTIAEIEPDPRDGYCGSVGFLSPQRRGWWNVAIRTAQFDGDRGRFDAGGGIVADSTADDEWRELAVKKSFLDSGFDLWETLAADAAPEIIGAHLARLERSAAQLDVPFDRDGLFAMMSAYRDGLLRVRLSRTGKITIVHEQLERSDEPVHVTITDQRVWSGDPWLRIKSSWRPKHRAAWAYAQEYGCFDALLRNERGELTEGSRTNLFVELEGVLWTPPSSCGLLPGILRERLIAQGVARERPLMPADLYAADAIYVGNSARGLLRALVTETQEQTRALRRSRDSRACQTSAG